MEENYTNKKETDSSITANGNEEPGNLNKETDSEFSADIGADNLIKAGAAWNSKKSGEINYINGVQALPESIKVLLIVSWVCAALAGFVSVYFSIPGVVTAYVANKAVPGIGRAALITNIALAVINLALSFAFIAAVKNIFALLYNYISIIPC